MRYRTNDYSAPVAYGHRNVLVRGYVDRVVISAGPRSSPAITAPTSGMILCSTPSTTCRCWSRRRRPWTRPLPCKDGTFPRSLPHCAGCWSPARDEGASGSSSRYCGYSSIFRLGRSTPRFGMPTGDSCRPTGSACPPVASAGGAPGAWAGAFAADC